jgi:O-antigen/teichoic acid export membrane protein
MAKNIGWVVGSRGVSSVISIAYLAVAARALGPAMFGVFALILTYAQLIGNLVQFQSWKGVIRYGALHVAAGRNDRLGRLFGFTAMLDVGSALAGAAIAFAAVPLVAPMLHWKPAEETSAAVFGAVLLLTTGATPTGMLRLFDRFDLVAYCESVGPLVRLIGASIAWAVGVSVSGMLWVWGIAAVAQFAVQWIAAIVGTRCPIEVGVDSVKQATRENDRIWSFMLQTNISNSVSMFWTQLGTLAVGAVAGPAEAGGFRLALRLSKGMLRPVQPAILAIYPELTRMVAESDHKQLRMTVRRITALAASLALAVVLFTWVFGREILHLLAGKDYEFAYPLLGLLCVASAIDLVGFIFEPLQNAHGRAWNVLRSKLVSAVVYGAGLLILLPTLGAAGAAWAAIACSLVLMLQLAWLAAKAISQPSHEAAASVSQ